MKFEKNGKGRLIENSSVGVMFKSVFKTEIGIFVPAQ